MANYNGVKLDNSGNGIVPYLTPYRTNEIILDPKGLSTDVELDSTSQKTVPVAGSIVLMKYKTKVGYSILISVKNNIGESIPFGSDIFNSEDELVGNIGQGSQGLVRVDKLNGKLKIKWGLKNNESCYIDYDITGSVDMFKPNNNQLRKINLKCL
ncbi:outer membrane usher protein FimD/PapC [Providencia alcalifaciens]|nr:outer membrane usher protein FimD/PapC [Providencia alcalifaciens]